jgi:MerR family transcriptional regulator, copper efflux regulator
MSKNGLFIGDVAKHSGASRKALRLYEAAGIMAPPRRTEAGYRVYGADDLDLLAFIRQAQRLGFTLEEIKEIVLIQRSGRLPCRHVHHVVLRKRADMDRRLADIREMRKRLDAVLRGWRSRCDTAAMCLSSSMSRVVAGGSEGPSGTGIDHSDGCRPLCWNRDWARCLTDRADGGRV